MATATVLRRRLVTFLAVTAALFVGAAVTATPAHATYGPTQPVDLQLRSYSNGVEYLVGRVVGTVQFDDGNSAYRLSLILCRQSSYTNPNVRITINNVQQQLFSPSDNTRRPEICGGFGLSGVISGDFGYAGVIPGLAVGIDGIHFDGSTARYVSKGAYYDNPYN